MLRLAPLCLLLTCAVSLSSSAVVLENGMPINWAQTTGQLTELPIKDGIVNPDPWNINHRMSLYRLMIASTDNYMGPMRASPTDSPMWGLPLQLGWMKTSGRLADPTGATTCGLETGDATCISTQSWWGCVNYFLSAMPFLSAVQQGFMGQGVQVQMQAPEGVTEYCTTYSDCITRYPNPMAKWDAFFQVLRDMSDSPLSDIEKKDAILGAFWDAQLASLSATAACNAKKSHYSSTEVSFALSWVNSAEYVSAAHFHSNLDKSLIFLSNVPSRVLKDGDNAPNIADLSQEENHTLSTFAFMKNMDTLLGGSLVRMWRGAMCSVTTREKGREVLEQVLVNPMFPTGSFLSLVTQMSTSC